MMMFLEGFLPRAIPDLAFQCVPHEGKHDLEKSVPRKLRAWKEPGVRFVVVIDNDGAPCKRTKTKLEKLCERAGRADTLVRIACQELEAWYLGDCDALARVFEDDALRELAGKPTYANPDAVVGPSDHLRQRIPRFQKISSARQMGGSMAVDEARNRSRSFQVFVSGVRALAAIS
ncbi:MAG: DUF4276 family protein [Deltaproteobacteria bacterium]|nr:DUF4276 family protein [Deltaproteobacteria bacterium]